MEDQPSKMLYSRSTQECQTPSNLNTNGNGTALVTACSLSDFCGSSKARVFPIRSYRNVHSVAHALFSQRRAPSESDVGISRLTKLNESARKTSTCLLSRLGVCHVQWKLIGSKVNLMSYTPSSFSLSLSFAFNDALHDSVKHTAKTMPKTSRPIPRYHAPR